MVLLPAVRKKAPIVVRGLSTLDPNGLGRVFADEKLAIWGGWEFGRGGHGLDTGWEPLRSIGVLGERNRQWTRMNAN